MEGIVEENQLETKTLPPGWKWVKLGDVCQTTSGGTPSRKEPKYYNGNIPWVKSGELDRGVITNTEEKISEDAIRNSSAKIFPKGTLLIALYGATIGKLAFLGVDAATNQAVCGIYQNDQINSQFLYYYLFFKKQNLVNQGIGGAQPNISQTILKNLEIPLGPLHQQRAIVSKIEELFSELDKGKQQLETALQQLKVYRQAVLKWAFEGKLTTGTAGWKLTKLKDAAIKIVVGYVGPVTAHIVLKGGIKFLSTTHIGENEFLNREIREVSHLFNNANKKSQVVPGDILIARHGDSGKACIVPHSISVAQVSNAVILRPNPEIINSKFICLRLNAERQSMQKMKVGGVFQVVNTKSMGDFQLAIPSIREQDIIVREIESRLSICNKVEQKIDTSLDKAETLRQIILKKAFEGKLISQRELYGIQDLAQSLQVPEIIDDRAGDNKKKKTSVQFPKRVEGISSTDLHAGVLAMVIDVHERNPVHHIKLSHVKGEKIAHLVEAHIGIDLGRVPMKDAAGPDDYPHLKKVESRANKANWFGVKKLKVGQTYYSKSGMPRIIQKLKDVVPGEQLAQIEKLIQTFLPFELEHAEVIATVYAGWNNLLLEGKNPTDEEIVYESRENWSKRKLGIERDLFFKTLKWMREHDYIPQGRFKAVLAKNSTVK